VPENIGTVDLVTLLLVSNFFPIDHNSGLQERLPKLDEKQTKSIILIIERKEEF